MPKHIPTLIDIAKIDLAEVRKQVSEIGRLMFIDTDTPGSNLDLDRIEWTLDALDQAEAHLTTINMKG